MVGGFSFYDRSEVKDLLSYMKLVQNPHDSIALQRVINSPARGIGKTTMETLERMALGTGLSTWDAMARAIAEINKHDVPTGALDITLYRDDLMRHAVGPQPVVRSTEIPFSIDDKKILLVDDVLYTGRTIRAALDALIDFGRPKSIQLVVLVDRGHRELPIKADYVGKNLPTSLSQSVQVHLQEVDGRDEVEIQEA